MSQSDSPPAFVPPPPYNLEDIPVYVDWQISWGSGFDEEEIARAEHDEKKTVVALEPSRRYEPILSESVLLPASNLCDVENELLVDEGAPSECNVPRPALRAQKSIEDTQGQVLRHQCQTARLLTTVWPINAAYKNLIRLWHPKALGRSQDISPGALEKGLAISNVDSSTLKDYTPRSSTAVTGSDGSSRWLLGRANQPTSAWSRFTTLFARERQPKSYEVNVRSGMLATNRSVSKSGGYAPIVPGGPQRYPEMARFLDSDDSFMVYQRFGYLQARLLLEKQERLRILEAQLDALDKRQTSQPGDEDVLCTLDIDEEFTPARDELTMKVEVAFNEYADLLQKSQAMVAMNRPTSREYRSVDNSIGNEMPLLPDEMKSFYRKEDLILPIYLLFKLTEGGQTPHSNAMSVGVLLVFTLAFSAVINLFTRAQRHEILAASAAYCAVLVVFFQNVGINSTPGRATTEALSGAEDDR